MEYAQYSQVHRNETSSSKSFCDLHDKSLISSGFNAYYDDFMANFLSKTEIFGDLGKLALDEIVRQAHFRRLPKKGDVLDEDDEGPLYFVVRGNVNLLSRSDTCTPIKNATKWCYF